MLREDHGMEDAAAAVHAAWMARPGNAKNDKNAHQHVPYEKLPEEEKQKDREHIHIVGRLFTENPRGKNESEPEHHERISNMFGSIAHEKFRDSLPPHERFHKDGKPVVRDRGVRGNVNLPWDELNNAAKADNLEAGRAAVAAHAKHMSGINESHTAEEIAGTPTAELRKLAATYEKSASDHGVKYEAAKKAGDSDKAEAYRAKMLKHTDEATDIRNELRKRTGMR
jgi:hypothetical protein